MEDTIKRPLINDFCDECVYCDKSGGDGGWQCKATHYVNCGQVIECSRYQQKELIDEYKKTFDIF